MSKNFGPAWFKHRRDDGAKLRVFIKGWFTPLHGYVVDVKGPAVLIQDQNGMGRWVTVSGKKSEVQNVEVLS